MLAGSYLEYIDAADLGGRVGGILQGLERNDTALTNTVGVHLPN